MKKAILIYLTMIPLIITAQKDSTINKLKLKIEAQTGITTYFGDLNNRKIKFTNNNIVTYKTGISANYKRLGILLHFTKGGYAQYQSTKINQSNFRNDFLGGGADIRYAFFSKKHLALFGGVGVEYLKVESKTDLFDENGMSYNYWNDGTIRDKPENYDNIFSSNQIKRDYNYETKIGTQNILFFPITFGAELNLCRGLDFGILTSVVLSNKKNINLVVDSKNRELLFQNMVFISYTFHRKPKDPPTKFDTVNFNELMNLDTDQDGIKDFYDQCPGTPFGKKVDKQGCLPDRDGDGIPDERDKEPNTKQGMAIDMDGVGTPRPTLKEIELESPPDPIESNDE